MRYVDTAEAVSITKLSYATLRRRALTGELTCMRDPHNGRSRLWVVEELERLEPSPNAATITEENRADLATLQFVKIAAAYEEGDRATAEELVNNTPAALVAPLVEFAVSLAFSAIEDDVDAATPEEIGAATTAVAAEV